MYIILELWEIIKTFLIVKPKKKSFPPYVWIHIKNFQLQGYWMKKYNEVMNEMPIYKTFVYPRGVLGHELVDTTYGGRPFIVYTSATKTPQFAKTFHTNMNVTMKNPIITYSIYENISK